MIRGFLGLLTTKVARRFRCESMSLYGFLQGRGLKMPAVTFRICLVAGKAKSKGKLEKHYRQLLQRGRQVA